MSLMNLDTYIQLFKHGIGTIDMIRYVDFGKDELKLLKVLDAMCYGYTIRGGPDIVELIRYFYQRLDEEYAISKTNVMVSATYVCSVDLMSIFFEELRDETNLPSAVVQGAILNGKDEVMKIAADFLRSKYKLSGDQLHSITSDINDYSVIFLTDRSENIPEFFKTIKNIFGTEFDGVTLSDVERPVINVNIVKHLLPDEIDEYNCSTIVEFGSVELLEYLMSKHTVDLNIEHLELAVYAGSKEMIFKIMKLIDFDNINQYYDSYIKKGSVYLNKWQFIVQRISDPFILRTLINRCTIREPDNCQWTYKYGSRCITNI